MVGFRSGRGGEGTFPALLTTECAELVLTNETIARTALQCLAWIACCGIQVFSDQGCIRSSLILLSLETFSFTLFSSLWCC